MAMGHDPAPHAGIPEDCETRYMLKPKHQRSIAMEAAVDVFGKVKTLVYYPPTAGCPFLAVVISEGRVLACHSVKSLTEGETMLRQILMDLPRLIKEVKEEENA
jgi:hypothetical protein